MTPWLRFVLVAAHHGLLVGLAILAGCALLRAIQSRGGAALGHEIALPPPRYGLWGAAGFGAGLAGAALHWLLFREGHGTLDVLLTGAMAGAGATIVWLSLDRRFTRDRRFLALYGALAPVVFLFYPNVGQRPNAADWLAAFEANYLAIAVLLIAFPLPKPPKRRKPRPRDGGKPPVPKDLSTHRIEPGVRRIEPRD